MATRTSSSKSKSKTTPATKRKRVVKPKVAPEVAPNVTSEVEVPKPLPKAGAPKTVAVAPRSVGTPAAKPAAQPVVKIAPKPSVALKTNGDELRKKEFVDAVVGRSGLKRREAKAATEAVLAILGEALAEGKDLVLPPLGKVKVNRTKDVAGAKVMICRVRQSTRAASKPGAGLKSPALAPFEDED